LALPCAQVAPSPPPTGSYQAPQESRTTPGATASVTTAPARQEPRPLNSRTTSPSAMPRLPASTGLIAIASRPATFARALTGPMSI
jgi:hypothetical protein